MTDDPRYQLCKVCGGTTMRSPSLLLCLLAFLSLPAAAGDLWRCPGNVLQQEPCGGGKIVSTDADRETNVVPAPKRSKRPKQEVTQSYVEEEGIGGTGVTGYSTATRFGTIHSKAPIGYGETQQNGELRSVTIGGVTYRPTRR